MRILVFGKNGQVARALQDIGGGGLVALGRDICDLMIEGAAREAIIARKPDIIVNAAAYTAVDKAETDETAARRLNTDAPAEMAEAASAIDASFIHISTDYVFDGSVAGRLNERAPVNPLNVYGQSKCDGERAVLKAKPQAIILRTSWVFSEYGVNFVKTMLKLAQTRDEPSIVADQIGGPTAAADIAAAIMTIAGKKYRGAPGSGVYHFQGAPAVSWADFAAKTFEISGRTISVVKITTEQYNTMQKSTPAARPLSTVLDCARIERDFGIPQPDWRASLRQVIAILNASNDMKD